MLKSLWPKSRKSDREGTDDQTESFRIHDHLTYTGEYHLERLSKLLELRYQRQFPWDTDSGIREMIGFASQVQHQDIQRELLLFYLNCSPTVQEYLKTGGFVDEAHYIHNPTDQE